MHLDLFLRVCVHAVGSVGAVSKLVKYVIGKRVCC
jgi:hypothetical protein